MKSFQELLKNRRSTRKYTGEPLTPEEVELILKAGLMAPSGKSKNPWEFVVIEEKSQLEKLAGCKKFGAGMLSHAALAIVVLGDLSVSDTWVEDASIATILMQLQAEDLGLGSCWVQIRSRETEHGESSEDFVRDMLELPLQMQVLSIVALGRKNEQKAPIDEEKLQWEKVHIGKW